MEASELKKGNWVSVVSAEEWIGQVTAIVPTSDMGYLISIPQVSNLPVDKFSPIPITQEWLLKCKQYVKLNWRFLRDEWGGYINFKDNLKLNIRFEDGELKFSIVTDDRKRDAYRGIKNIRLKYVHQLQNLYNSFTEEELDFADNKAKYVASNNSDFSLENQFSNTVLNGDTVTVTYPPEISGQAGDSSMIGLDVFLPTLCNIYIPNEYVENPDSLRGATLFRVLQSLRGTHIMPFSHTVILKDIPVGTKLCVNNLGQ